MAEGLKINITADVAEATKGLSAVDVRAAQLEANIKKLQDTIANTTSQRKLSAAMAALEQQQRAYNQTATLTTAKLSNVSPAAGQATMAMTNLSRVVQDAPYGFIGIANNLNPLLESFQRLSTTAGGAGGAMKALGATLLGPGGVGLALGAVTAAISLSQLGFDRWFKSSQDAKKGNEEFAASTIAAVSEIDKIKSALDQGSASYNRFAASREKNVKLAFGESPQTELLLLQGQGLQLQTEKYNVEKAIEATYIAQRKLQDQYYGKVKDAYGNLIYTEEQYNKEFTRITDERFKYLEQQNQLEAKGYEQVANIKLKKIEVAKFERDKIKEYNDDIIAQAKKVSDFVGEAITIRLNVTPLDSDAEILQKSKEYLDKWKKGLYNYSLTVPPAELTVPVRFSDDPVEIEKSVSPVGALIKQEMERYFQRTEKLDASLLFAVDEQKLKRFSALGFENLTKAQKDLAETGAVIADVITPSLQAMIQAVGRGENAFKAFGEGVKAILLQVIQKLTATAILAGVLAALFPQGIGGSQGFGQIFGKLLGFRANGGPVTGNSPYIVGERGPELFVPSVSGSIVPNNQVGSFGGGRMSGGGSSSVLRGQDILLAYARTQRSQLRVNG